jgi:hypothetical protein
VANGLAAVLKQDAFDHRDLQATDGRRANGMSVMMMGASTGCNTVYGSTPPANPHPYPWMNSLFQDGATISWLMAESVILSHARRSVAPERLADLLLDRDGAVTEADVFTLTHLDDAVMTEQEIRELPKVWVVGGDGALGDIGFQNVSKVILQNRPNVKILMLDTQVYSNTGGQNSDSSTMLGGYDMNQFGVASQGKLIEKKNVAEAFTAGMARPSSRRFRWPTRPNSTRPCSTASSIAAPPSSSATPPASPSTAWVTTCRRTRPSWCATDVACRSLCSIRAGAKPRRGDGHQGQSDPRPRLVADEVRQHRRRVRLHGGPLGGDRRPLPEAREIHHRGGCRQADAV